MTVSREPLRAKEVVVRHGVPRTRVHRALFDGMRGAGDRREAVVAMDMAAAADLVSVRRLHDAADRCSDWRRSRWVRSALAQASGMSRSPDETGCVWCGRSTPDSPSGWSTRRC